MSYFKKILIFMFVLLLSACSQNAVKQDENMSKEQLERTEKVFSSLMNKDWKEFASHIHVERGLVYSPFSNVGDSDDLHFSKEEVEGF